MNVLSLLPLNFHSSDDEAYDALARHLSALKEALCNLGAPIARESDRHQKLAPTVNPVPLVASGLPRRTLQTQSNIIHSSHGPLHHPAAEATPSEPLFINCIGISECCADRTETCIEIILLCQKNLTT